jgi:hypothetical protein
MAAAFHITSGFGFVVDNNVVKHDHPLLAMKNIGSICIEEVELVCLLVAVSIFSLGLPEFIACQKRKNKHSCSKTMVACHYYN